MTFIRTTRSFSHMSGSLSVRNYSCSACSISFASAVGVRLTSKSQKNSPEWRHLQNELLVLRTYKTWSSSKTFWPALMSVRI